MSARLLLFLFCALLFLLHQILSWVGVKIPLLDQYLDALCLMPILLWLRLKELQLVWKRPPDHRFSVAELTGFLIFICFVTEFLFPLWSDRFTADPLDALMYVFGTLAWFIAQETDSAPSADN